MTVFTDQEAAVEELEWLTNTTGKAHVIVRAGRGEQYRWRVVPHSEVGKRDPLVICTPKYQGAS
ncbi:hypothetical protein [uncultured Alcanivorax sp.]|uniref:hypothetical protein n=1 Tax=uncultured Alcanivorax sp. TaxID=191215 RepID=UPI0032B26968